MNGFKEDSLSPKEIECLYWFGQGKTAEEIGMLLNLKKRTVENYLLMVRNKMQLNKTWLAVARAVELHLISL